MCCSFQQIFAFNIVRVGGPNISFICILSKWSFPSCCPCYKLSCWYTLRQTINFRPKILVSVSDSESLSPSLNISVSNSQCLILRVSVSVWESKSRHLSLRVHYSSISGIQYLRVSVAQYLRIFRWKIQFCPSVMILLPWKAETCFPKLLLVKGYILHAFTNFHLLSILAHTHPSLSAWRRQGQHAAEPFSSASSLFKSLGQTPSAMLCHHPTN